MSAAGFFGEKGSIFISGADGGTMKSYKNRQKVSANQRIEKNSKFQARNPNAKLNSKFEFFPDGLQQIRISKKGIFLRIGYLNFGFVSSFDLRIADFPKHLFGSGYAGLGFGSLGVRS
jgi:hypothetical protein